MTERDLLELKLALERLRNALLEAMRALDDAAGTPPDAPEPYALHGAPFGPDMRANRLWNAFGQFTTPN